MKRKITILGMGRSATLRQLDMQKHVIGEVWGLNNGYNKFPQIVFDRYYELHTYDYLKDWDSGQECHFTTLDFLDTPIYRIETLPIIRKQVIFDIVEYCRHFGLNYFLGSPSLMLMQALYEHDMGQEIGEIRTWGLDFSDEQHLQQKASWAFWISKAIERNIRLSGTACGFFAEEDIDAGLGELKNQMGSILLAGQNAS